ncbi:FAD-dependent oxidoreductase [Sphingomonas sp. GB1N7]|uniref:FAD-dependent oxidoreductase n=1 Tax=Parasphingomonas caseinilytica TaxID=3096158 RepID=UPI002FC8EBBE
MFRNEDSGGIGRRKMMGDTVFTGLGLVGVGSGLGGCTTMSDGRPIADPYGPPPLARVRASVGRIFDTTVCLRPFRAAGPRLDAEQVGGKLVVHNYGHGGSGWSLSWGSAEVAVGKAMANSPKEIAVIGCGALGITAAIHAQHAGAKVTIYARDLLPQTRSARATGSWTPDSRIALADADPAFGDLWEKMARSSFKTYRRYLGLPGSPVEWNDRYTGSDTPIDSPHRPNHAAGDPEFASYGARIRDLTPRSEKVPAGSTPFAIPYLYRSESMMFNIADLGHTLMLDFFAAGGLFKRMEFNTPADIANIAESVVIDCTGYGARALWKDESIIPVRGQIAWLIPQAEVTYGLYYKGVSMLSRKDGIVIQANDRGEGQGYRDANETVDRAEAEHGVAVIAQAYAGFGMPKNCRGPA